MRFDLRHLSFFIRTYKFIDVSRWKLRKLTKFFTNPFWTSNFILFLPHWIFLFQMVRFLNFSTAIIDICIYGAHTACKLYMRMVLGSITTVLHIDSTVSVTFNKLIAFAIKYQLLLHLALVNYEAFNSFNNVQVIRLLVCQCMHIKYA